MSECATSSTKIPAAAGVRWDDLPDMVSPAHLAALFGVDRKTISRWHKEERKLPHPTIASGNVVRWQKSTLRAWCDTIDTMK
jgi:predicted DNA-binding transcriptional regulator AlpA